MIRWGYLIFFPNDDSLAYRILELTAISGELPASLLHSLSYSRDYIYNVISYLRKNNLLRVFHQDKVRGYRLTSHAKEILLLKNPDRFCPFLTGNVETNLLKRELNRRIRLHCIAEVNLLMLYGNVAVFPDKKPVVFTPQKMRLPRSDRHDHPPRLSRRPRLPGNYGLECMVGHPKDHTLCQA